MTKKHESNRHRIIRERDYAYNRLLEISNSRLPGFSNYDGQPMRYEHLPLYNQQRMDAESRWLKIIESLEMEYRNELDICDCGEVAWEYLEIDPDDPSHPRDCYISEKVCTECGVIRTGYTDSL